MRSWMRHYFTKLVNVTGQLKRAPLILSSNLSFMGMVSFCLANRGLHQPIETVWAQFWPICYNCIRAWVRLILPPLLSLYPQMCKVCLSDCMNYTNIDYFEKRLHIPAHAKGFIIHKLVFSATGRMQEEKRAALKLQQFQLLTSNAIHLYSFAAAA